MNKKFLLFLFIVPFFLTGCFSKTKEDHFFLTNLNNIFPLTNLSAAEKERLGQMLLSLSDFVDVESLKTLPINPSDYYQNSLFHLTKIVKELNLNIALNNNSLMIINNGHGNLDRLERNKISSDDKSELGGNSNTIIFPIVLQQEKITDFPADHSTDITYDNIDHTIYGYQSLYPKGTIISLLYMLKELSNLDSNTNVQIMIIKSTDNLSKTLKDFTDKYGDPLLVVCTDGVYPFVKEIKGDVHYTLKIKKPEWLTDITTSEDDHQKNLWNISITYKKDRVVKKENLIFKTPNPYYEKQKDLDNQNYIIQLLNKMSTLAQSEGNDSESDQLLNNAVVLLKTCGKDWKLSTGSLDNVKINSISTTDNNLVISLSSDVINESDLAQSLRDFFARINVTKLENTKMSLVADVSINHYTPSYNYSVSNNFTKKLTEIPSEIYKNVYKIIEKPVVLDVGYQSLATYFDNSIIIGTSFSSNHFYKSINFIPQAKLYKDYEFYLELIQKIKDVSK